MIKKPQTGICVDASCLGNPGPMQYRMARIDDGSVLFESESHHGTNNIGEFLAVVHALSFCKNNSLPDLIYTDSVTAMAWVRKCSCNTKLYGMSVELNETIRKCEAWLRENSEFTNGRIQKWDTKAWGEIPADFGRK